MPHGDSRSGSVWLPKDLEDHGGGTTIQMWQSQVCTLGVNGWLESHHGLGFGETFDVWETAHTDDWINFSRRFDGSDWGAWMTDSWRTLQTQELADLVRSQTATSTNPAGTMKGLSKQTEELVFLMKAV